MAVGPRKVVLARVSSALADIARASRRTGNERCSGAAGRSGALRLSTTNSRPEHGERSRCSQLVVFAPRRSRLSAEPGDERGDLGYVDIHRFGRQHRGSVLRGYLRTSIPSSAAASANDSR